MLEDADGQEQPVDTLSDEPIIQEAFQYMNVSKKENIKNNADVWKVLRRKVHKLDHREETTLITLDETYLKMYGSDYSIKLPDEEFVPFILDDITSYGIPLPEGEIRSVEEYWSWLLQQEGIEIERTSESDYMAIDVPRGMIDSSTYNEYFSAPQIDKAVKHISRLFQDHLALSVVRIIYYVQKRDPTIESEFIYSALDLLVGNPPVIKPKLFTDKFGRKGYIIFHNNYYIFQPQELRDTSIPLQYRKEPLTIKSRFYDLNLLDQNTAAGALAQKEYVADIDMVERFIEEEVSDNTVEYCINLYIKLDQKHPAEQIMIMESVIHDFITADKHMEDIYNTPAAIVEYFMRSGILYCLSEDEKVDSTIQDLLLDPTVTIVHVLRHSASSGNILSFYNRAIGKWNQSNMSIDTPQKQMLETVWDTVVSYPSIFTLTTVDVFVQLNSKIHGYMGKASASRNLAPYDKPSAILDVIKKHYDHYPDPVALSEAGFKIVDINRQRIRNTKTGIASNKTILRGATCANLSIKDAGNSLDVIRNLYAVARDAYDLTELSSSTNDKSNICNQLERALRILDVIRYNPDDDTSHNRRWFLSPLETEYYYKSVK
jgi:hypothetical protein